MCDIAFQGDVASGGVYHFMLEFLVDTLKEENFFVLFVGPETLIFSRHCLCWSPCFGTTLIFILMLTYVVMTDASLL